MITGPEQVDAVGPSELENEVVSIEVTVVVEVDVVVDSDVVVLVMVTIRIIGGNVSQLIEAVGGSVIGSPGTVMVVGGGHPVV
jgi:hypothetical protein